MAFTRLFLTTIDGPACLSGRASPISSPPASGNWYAWPAPDNYGGGNPSGRHIYVPESTHPFLNLALSTDSKWLSGSSKIITSVSGSVGPYPTFVNWNGSQWLGSYAAGGTPRYATGVAVIPFARFSIPFNGVSTVIQNNIAYSPVTPDVNHPAFMAFAVRARNFSQTGSNMGTLIWFPHAYVWRPSTNSVVGWLHLSTWMYSTIPGFNSLEPNVWKSHVQGVNGGLSYANQVAWASNVAGCQDGDLLVWESYHVVLWYYSNGGVPSGGYIGTTVDLSLMGNRVIVATDPGIVASGSGYPDHASHLMWNNEAVNVTNPIPRRKPDLSVSG